jgi:hypothetical protein
MPTKKQIRTLPGTRLARKSRKSHVIVMVRPTHVEALPGSRLRLTYADGVESIIDLSAEVGRGVFAPLADEAFFRTVHIGEYGQIAWSSDIEICSDAAYTTRTFDKAPASVS